MTEWQGELGRREIPAGGALFHLPGALRAYGDLDKYDLGSESGLLAFVVDYVNRVEETKWYPAPPKDQNAGPVTVGAVGMRSVGRGQLRVLLRAAVHGPSAPDEPNLQDPSDKLLADLQHWIEEDVTWRRSIVRTATGAELRHHAHILDYQAFYALVAILLMNEQRRRELGYCKQCGRAFLVQKREQHQGRPERSYCGKKHRDEAHEQGAAGRQLQVRARRLLERVHGREASREAVAAAFEQNPNVTSTQQLADLAKAVVKSTRKHK